MDEEIDKTSVKYFMEQMTQKEFNKMRSLRSKSCFETGWTRDERYIMNKIRSDYLDKLEKKLQDEEVEPFHS